MWAWGGGASLGPKANGVRRVVRSGIPPAPVKEDVSARAAAERICRALYSSIVSSTAVDEL